jgi:hypothetical protein
MSEQATYVRTDELRPGDRVWHPFDIVCFTVAHKPEPVALDFEGERGLRVTGTDDRGETVHIDVAPGYRWHRRPQTTAPTTHAPLVVNTRDGVCWTRRTVTSGGIALYAPESVKTCPDFVMATEAELAEHGIVGSAYALPMPVDPGPVVRPIALNEAQIDALTASGNRAVNDLVHEDLCDCDAWPEKCLSSGGFFQGYWDWGYLETAVPAVLGLWESMRGGELERLRARVAELEAGQENPLAFAEKLDGKSLDNFLIALGTATEHEPLDGAIAQIHELIRSYREGKPAEEDCDHPNGHGPYGCAGCGAFAPPDDEDDVTPQVAKLRAVLAEDPARCVKVHPFSPRDGWRTICANCDHTRNEQCHTGGDVR